MATRHQARVSVVQVLYSIDMGNSDAIKHINEVLEAKKVRNSQKDFVISLVNGVMNNIVEIDLVINSKLKDWSLDKIAMLDKALLRLGTYEILYTNTDRAIIINEALEIAKSFSSDTSTKLINGVLDKVKNETLPIA
jgi:N utilization substance protein B